jgi:hypothetical protein
MGTWAPMWIRLHAFHSATEDQAVMIPFLAKMHSSAGTTCRPNCSSFPQPQSSLCSRSSHPNPVLVSADCSCWSPPGQRMVCRRWLRGRLGGPVDRPAAERAPERSSRPPGDAGRAAPRVGQLQDRNPARPAAPILRGAGGLGARRVKAAGSIFVRTGGRPGGGEQAALGEGAAWGSVEYCQVHLVALF